MIPDLDVFRTANILVKQHGQDAPTVPGPKSVTERPDLSAFSESVKPLTQEYRVNRMLALGAG